jgi:hypothetical protein
MSGANSSQEAARLVRLAEWLEPVARVLGPILDDRRAGNLRMPKVPEFSE